METKDKVYSILKSATKALRPGEIADQANLDKKEVDKAIATLKKEAKIYSPARCVYSVK
jgi:biotin operon repressor